jgi:hypothetical protein
MASELSELLERVKAATGPDRELDDAIRHAIDGKMVEPQLLWRETFPYTASIDDALALTERMLPGWAWCVQKIVGVPSRAPTQDCEADLWVPAAKDAQIVWAGKRRFRADGATPALAILAALLSALEAKP